MVPFSAGALDFLPFYDLEFNATGMRGHNILVIIRIGSVFIYYFFKINVVMHEFFS
jgi:hypothetical protein